MRALFASLVVFIMFSISAKAAPAIGEPAPNFTGLNIAGKEVTLSQYKDKIVVLEWTNPGCPFVKKFYRDGAMQKWQADAREKGIIWLSINSSATGKEGQMNAEDAQEWLEDKAAKPTEYLLDPEGKIGHLYEAKTTPHMFVIDTSGVLAYAGAIDDKPSTDSDDIEGATHYVSAAIDALKNGKKVKPSTTQPYGCPVKY